MRFHIEKLGCIEKADIELGDLTILCGDNNTGKTYISYSIYGFLKFWDEITASRNDIYFKLSKEELNELKNNKVIKKDLNLLKKDADEALKSICDKYTKEIHKVFSSGEDFFNATSFYCDIDYSITKEKYVSSVNKRGDFPFLETSKEENSSVLEIRLLPTIPSDSFDFSRFINYSIWRAIFNDYLFKLFYITSERNAIALFYRDLDKSKNFFIENLQERITKKTEDIDIKDFFDIKDISRYSRPIKDSIDFIRDIPDICKTKSDLIKEHPELDKELRKIAGGDYKVEDNQIFFLFKRGRKNQIIPLYMASSTVKSLVDLNFYIRHHAKKGDILMIDEPELNLHPANQRRIARLFVRLINAGIKIFVTTHSDYLIQELNNLIVLGNNFDNRNKIMKKHGYSEDDVLDKNKVRLYIVEDTTLKPIRISDLGMEVNSFDREIREMNRIYDDMTVSMDIAYGNN